MEGKPSSAPLVAALNRRRVLIIASDPGNRLKVTDSWYLKRLFGRAILRAGSSEDPVLREPRTAQHPVRVARCPHWGRKIQAQIEWLLDTRGYKRTLVDLPAWAIRRKPLSKHLDNSVGKESARSTGDVDSIPGLGRSLVEGEGYPLQYSGLENSMDSPWGRKESDTTEQLSLSLSEHAVRSVARLTTKMTGPPSFLERRWGTNGDTFESCDVFPVPGVSCGLNTPFVGWVRTVTEIRWKPGSSRGWMFHLWFSRQVVSDSLRPHGLQPAGLPCLGFPRQEYWSGLPFTSAEILGLE